MAINYSLAVMLVNDDVKLIRCRFLSDDRGSQGKLYTFKTLLKNLEVGDKVIVNANNTFNIVEVREIGIAPEMQNTQHTYKWAFQKLDIDTYNTIKENEEKAIDHIKRLEAANLKKSLAAQLGLEGVQQMSLTRPTTNYTQSVWTHDCPVIGREITLKMDVEYCPHCNMQRKVR